MDKKLRNKIRAAIESVPVVSSADILEKKGLWFRLNRQWLKEVVNNIEEIFEENEYNN